MELPYNWDFIQNNIPPEKLAELRRRFMEEWRSGRYTKKEMMERYRMSERTFRNTIKKYADAEELDDYKDRPLAPNNPHRKFTDEEYNDVVETFDSTREKQKKPKEFQRPTEPGNCFCIDTGACFIGDKAQIQFQPVFDEFNSELVVLVAGLSCDYTLSLKALEELCRL